MAFVRVGSKRQVVIPKAIREKLGIAPGDYVNVTYRRNAAIIRRITITDDFPITGESSGPTKQPRRKKTTGSSR